MRKDHPTFNEVKVAIAKVNSIFKEQIASQVSYFCVKTKQHLQSALKCWALGFLPVTLAFLCHFNFTITLGTKELKPRSVQLEISGFSTIYNENLPLPRWA